MQKRKTLDKIPIQANFYPLPSMAFLQDKSTRLTLLSAQSNGVAGLNEGTSVLPFNFQFFSTQYVILRLFNDLATRYWILQFAKSERRSEVRFCDAGEFQVVLDRRLYQDDNRGLGQGVTDNKVTPANFRLVVERFKSPHEPVSRISSWNFL